MEYRRLDNSALEVSAVCLGTMTFGEQNSEVEAHAQLDFAFAQGVNFIDTAELYPVPPRAETYARTETLVGRWLRHQPRDKVILATKVAGPARGMHWIRGGPNALDAVNLHAAVDHSLNRLQTDYIDLYQLHWPERNTPMFGQYRFDPAREREGVPIEVQLRALDDLVRAGKVRYVGLSNEHPWGVMEFLRLAREFSLPRIVSIQNAYNLLNRVFETTLAEVAYREHLALLVYSPLAFGHLTGKYLADSRAAGRITQFASFGQRYTKPNVRPAVAAYVELARQHGWSPTQLALAFVRSRSFVTSTIVGATSLTQLQENLDAFTRTLPDTLLREIEDIHLRYTNPAP